MHPNGSMPVQIITQYKSMEVTINQIKMCRIFIGLKKPEGTIIFSSSYIDVEYKNLKKNMKKCYHKYSQDNRMILAYTRQKLKL
jgi:hypothetical protein